MKPTNPCLPDTLGLKYEKARNPFLMATLENEKDKKAHSIEVDLSVNGFKNLVLNQSNNLKV